METVVGLMSGTSMDGVDAAVITTDGELVGDFGPTRFRPYTEAERTALKEAAAAARTIADRYARPGVLAEAEAIVTDAHGEAVERLIEDHPGIAPTLVGFHGQTVFHAPARRLTVQIGSGRLLAQRLGLPVVHDFRAADVAAGGEGAPFVPVYHRALVHAAGIAGDVVVLNLGGVANLTRLGADGSVSAADTGPGNALLDDLMRRRTGDAMDRDGAVAAAGRVDEQILAALLADPWFDLPPPKSLDRDAFALDPVLGLATVDAAATLAAFTARSIAKGIGAAGGAATVIVAGGGARNPVLLAMIAEAVGVRVMSADSLGWSGDFLEAQAFAFLAARSLRGLPLSYPETTGVPRPMPGGILSRPE